MFLPFWDGTGPKKSSIKPHMPGHPNMKVLEQLARLVGNGVGSSMLDRQLGSRRVRAATIASYPLMGTCISNMFGLQGSWSHYSTEVSSNYDPRNKTQAKVNNIELMMIQLPGRSVLPDYIMMKMPNPPSSIAALSGPVNSVMIMQSFFWPSLMWSCVVSLLVCRVSIPTKESEYFSGKSQFCPSCGSTWTSCWKIQWWCYLWCIWWLLHTWKSGWWKFFTLSATLLSSKHGDARSSLSWHMLK